MHGNEPVLPRIALLGGSFNPPHIGHFRIALEVWEALRPERLLFIPSAMPPHKRADGLLPFGLRVRMLQAVLRGLPDPHGRIGLSGMDVCTIENERPGPSYTVDTLIALAGRYPGHRPAFIMGGEDLPLLPSWDRWEQLAGLAELVVLPRGKADAELIVKTILAQWPGARSTGGGSYGGSGGSLGGSGSCGGNDGSLPHGGSHGFSRGGINHGGSGGSSCNGGSCGGSDGSLCGGGSGGIRPFSLPGGGRILLLDRPRLDISSSTLRQRWLRGDRLDFLLPAAVLELLEENRKSAGALWRGE